MCMCNGMACSQHADCRCLHSNANTIQSNYPFQWLHLTLLAVATQLSLLPGARNGNYWCARPRPAPEIAWPCPTRARKSRHTMTMQPRSVNPRATDNRDGREDESACHQLQNAVPGALWRWSVRDKLGTNSPCRRVRRDAAVEGRRSSQVPSAPNRGSARPPAESGHAGHTLTSVKGGWMNPTHFPVDGGDSNAQHMRR